MAEGGHSRESSVDGGPGRQMGLRDLRPSSGAPMNFRTFPNYRFLCGLGGLEHWGV